MPSLVDDAVGDAIQLDFESCPNSQDESHCVCWWECEACCRCGDTATEDGSCDCDKHERGAENALQELRLRAPGADVP